MKMESLFKVLIFVCFLFSTVFFDPAFGNPSSLVDRKEFITPFEDSQLVTHLLDETIERIRASGAPMKCDEECGETIEVERELATRGLGIKVAQCWKDMEFRQRFVQVIRPNFQDLAVRKVTIGLYEEKSNIDLPENIENEIQNLGLWLFALGNQYSTRHSGVSVSPYEVSGLECEDVQPESIQRGYLMEIAKDQAAEFLKETAEAAKDEASGLMKDATTKARRRFEEILEGLE